MLHFGSGPIRSHMKPIFCSVIFLVLLAAGISAQSAQPEVELTGTVLSVENAYDSKFPDKQFFRVIFYLQVRNNSDRPVILLRQDLPTYLGDFMEPCFRKSIEFVTDQGSGQSFPAPHNAALDWRSINGDPSSQKPPNACKLYARGAELGPVPWLIVAANSSYEFRDSIIVDRGYEYELEPGEKWKDVAGREPKALYPFLRVLYRVSLKDIDSELLRTKQQEWKKSGHLPLDSSGNYVLRSDVLVNYAPNTISNETTRP